MKDKYDIAIEYLTEYPEEILDTWNSPFNYPHGCLFQMVTPSGNYQTPEWNSDQCGCLTQVKYKSYPAWTPELTNEICNDERIPSSRNITVADLPVFAEWQRRLDREIRGGIKEEV